MHYILMHYPCTRYFKRTTVTWEAKDDTLIVIALHLASSLHPLSQLFPQLHLHLRNECLRGTPVCRHYIPGIIRINPLSCGSWCGRRVGQRGLTLTRINQGVASIDPGANSLKSH